MSNDVNKTENISDLLCDLLVTIKGNKNKTRDSTIHLDNRSQKQNKMSSDKYLLAQDVLRPNFGHCFHLIPKESDARATCSIPTPQAARGTAFERVTVVIEDISIRVNQFAMGDFKATGRHLINFLLADVHRAFTHKNIHTYVLVSDMSVFGVEAKEEVQEQRRQKAKRDAETAGIQPYPWDADNPTPIVDISREMPRLLALQCTPGAVRQTLFEAMVLIAETFQAPAGKRLIVHMEPRQYTNPGLIEDFMPTDPLTSGIVISDDRADVVEAARRRLAACADKLTPAAFRRAARDATTELARAGCFYTIPICCETSVGGVVYKPFRLPMMKFQVGEADLSIQRYVTYLYTGAIVPRLDGVRAPPSIKSMAHFYTPAQQASFDAPTGADAQPYVGANGPRSVQCAAVLSTDTDFCLLLTYTVGVLVAKHDTTRTADDPSGVDYYREHSPLLVRGTVYTRTRDRLAQGQTRTYYSESAKVEFPLLKSYEVLDPMELYCAIVNGAPSSSTPLAIVIADAARRMAAAADKRKETAAKKRAISEGVALDTKKQKTDGGSRASSSTTDIDEPVAMPCISLAPIAASATPDERFARLASFTVFTCMLGNDYLAGVQGVSRDWCYAAFAQLMSERGSVPLVRVLRADGVVGAAPSLPMMVDYSVYESLLAYCYYMNLVAQACKVNKPSKPPSEMSLAEVSAAVGAKYDNKPTKMPPPEDERLQIVKRLTWVLRYFTNGSTSIRHILDPLEFGWEGKWRKLIV